MTQEHVAHSGLQLPVIGLGTWKLAGAAGVKAVEHAISAGYTLIDSAIIYENEGAVGHAIRSNGVSRERVIVTSKLPGSHHARRRAEVAIEESVYRTGLEMIDLYLIHWPDPEQDRYVEAWQALIEAKAKGIVRAIGVSNFHQEHLERLHDETGVLPEVNQIELHPFRPREELVSYHARHGILTEAWGPLAQKEELLRDPVVVRIAKHHGASSAQVVLAWAIACGVIPIPKATTPARQRENLAAAELSLSAEEVVTLTRLGK